jgi:2-desacetyl-2-hydroxyethyl bacteriochlorophyllide A dehydrogenase
MKSIVLERPGRLRLREQDPPTAPAGDEALVRVRAVGVCGTDFHAYRGDQPFFTYPRILGHEIAVEILQTGSGGGGLRPGQRCAVEPYLNCGRCVACRAAKTNCCAELQVLGVHLDGGLRETMRVPAAKLHRSERLGFEHLALVEPLAVGAHAVGRAQLQPGEFALVIGVGPIGLAVAQFARLAGAKLIVADLDGQRLEFCREWLRTEHCLAAGDDLAQRAREITGGEMPTAVFDATGSARSMSRAFDCVAHGGRLTLVGLCQGPVAFDDPSFHRRELTVLSSRNATAEDFRRVIAELEQGRIAVERLISRRTSLEPMIEEFPRWSQPGSGVIKAVVEVADGKS